MTRIDMDRAADTTALLLTCLRERTKNTPEIMFVLVMALMATNSELMALERGEQARSPIFLFSPPEVQDIAEQLYKLMAKRKVNVLLEQKGPAGNA